MRRLTWIVALLLLVSLPAEAKGRRRTRWSERPKDVAASNSNIGLSLGLHFGALVVDDFHLVSGDTAVGFIGGWIGGTFHPRPARASPFVALGLELGAVFPPSVNGNQSRAAVEAVPSARLGIAATSGDLGHLFPDLELYVLGGYRIPNHFRGQAIRLGVGLSIPSFAREQVKWFKIPFIPWMVDLFYDYSPRHEVGVRAGYHF